MVIYIFRNGSGTFPLYTIFYFSVCSKIKESNNSIMKNNYNIQHRFCIGAVEAGVVVE